MNLKIPLTYIHIKDVFSKLDKNIICTSTSASNDQPNSTYKKNSFSRVTTLVTMETDVNSLTRSSPLTLLSWFNICELPTSTEHVHPPHFHNSRKWLGKYRKGSIFS